MADGIKLAQLQEFKLAGAGVSSTDISVRIRNFTQIDGTALTMTDFGTKGFGTLEPNTSREEAIVWTGITNNGDGTSTLTGVSRVLTVDPYTETSGLAKTHAGGTVFVVSNNPGLLATFANKKNDETIEETFTFTNPNYPRMDSAATEPTDDEQLIPKKYSDDNKIDKDGTLAMAAVLDMAGNQIDMNTAKIVNLVIPTANKDAATKDYVDGVAIAGAPDANETTKGIVEIATTAEFDAGTDIGGTGAVLVVRPSDINSRLVAVEKFGGDGSDGALTVSSGTTSIDLGGLAFVVKNFTSISITGTGAIDFINPNANGSVVILRSEGDVTLTSSATPMIDGTGIGATGGAGGSQTATTDNTHGADGTNGVALSLTTVFGEGSDDATGGTAPTAYDFSATLITEESLKFKYPNIAIGSGGGGGQAVRGGGGSGTAIGGNGGRGGGALLIECAGAWNFTTTGGISVAGSDGTDGTFSGDDTDTAGAGGGGGGAGSFFALHNSLVANSGTIVVSGGTGGLTVETFAGTPTGGGGGASSINDGDDGVGASNGVKSGGDGATGDSKVISNTEFA